MFESIKERARHYRFTFLLGKIRAHLLAARHAGTAHDHERELLLLEKIITLGEQALAIPFQSPPSSRAGIEIIIAEVRALYNKRNALVQLSGLSEAELELVGEVTSFYSDLRLPVPIDRLGDMFEVAKNRLDDPPEVLKLLYNPQVAPPALHDVMSKYISGELTKEGARALLTHHSETITKWLPVLVSVLTSDKPEALVL